MIRPALLLQPATLLRIRRVATPVLVAGLALLPRGVATAQSSPAPTRFHLSHAAMGTEFTLDLYAAAQSAAEDQANLAFDEIDRLEDLLSNYKPTSELSRISREAGNGAVTTDPETFHFLERSLFWSERSSGAFDITVGPLLKAWGLYQHGGRVPSEPEVQALRDTVGWEKIRLNKDDRGVAFANHRTLDLDPGSIGKGFAVESAVRLLREAGVQSALLSAGGSTLYAIGAPPGEPGWPVKIDDPRSANTLAATVYLKDTSLSTGACTQKYFIKDGHRYCHIFNPRTMRPVEGVLQTTVISPSATDSDALSTVVFVLPPEASRQVLKDLPNTQALIFLGPAPASGCVAINWQGNPCPPRPPTQQKEPQP